jgi:hypothetical protein
VLPSIAQHLLSVELGLTDCNSLTAALIIGKAISCPVDSSLKLDVRWQTRRMRRRRRLDCIAGWSRRFGGSRGQQSRCPRCFQRPLPTLETSSRTALLAALALFSSNCRRLCRVRCTVSTRLILVVWKAFGMLLLLHLRKFLPIFLRVFWLSTPLGTNDCTDARILLARVLRGYLGLVRLAVKDECCKGEEVVLATWCNLRRRKSFNGDEDKKCTVRIQKWPKRCSESF